MRRFKFTIGSLLLLVLFAGVAFAALREATPLWDSGVFSASVVLLLAAVLLSVHRTAEARAFWLGFALFGAAYLIASLVPLVESRLVTRDALIYLDSKTARGGIPFSFTFAPAVASPNPGKVVALAFSPDGRSLATPVQQTVQLWDATTGKLISGSTGSTEVFVRIGHSLWALIFAFAGGHFSRALFRANLRRLAAVAAPGDEAPRLLQNEA